MARSELFLLLPVYKEAQGQPGYVLNTDVPSEDELKETAKKIDETADFFQNENYSGYYDSDNLKGFLLPATIAEDCYPNTATRFRSIMKRWGEDWRREKRQDEEDDYRYYCQKIENDTLCEIIKRNGTDTDGCTFLLVNHNAISCKDDFIRAGYNNESVDINVSRLDFKDIARWFETNRRPQRVFNWNPKHGEFGKGAHPSNGKDKVSVLMGSRGEAGRLLHKAFGLQPGTLYFFDEKYDRYIEFKREGENIYHAFHIAPEDEDRIPDLIKERIKIIRQ